MSGEKNSRYLARYAKMAKLLCQAGATDEELADFFGVSVSTIYLWKKKHKPFSEATKDGKQYADEKVVSALYQNALGAETWEEKVVVVDGQVHKSTVRKQHAPNHQAQSLWLRNRRPDEWRDKQDHEHSGDIRIQVVTGIERSPNDPVEDV